MKNFEERACFEGSYAASSIVNGLLISIPLWAIIIIWGLKLISH